MKDFWKKIDTTKEASTRKEDEMKNGTEEETDPGLENTEEKGKT